MGESLQWGMPVEHNFYQHDDPWDLPPYFLLRKNKWKSLRTHSGYWKEKEEELTAIRSAGESSSSSTASPSYVGVRKTLEFYLKDGTKGGEGTKTDWIIHEYHHLRKDDTEEALFLQEDFVLRKVFKKCKNKTDQESCLYRQVESCVKAYKELKQVYCSRTDHYGNNTEIILQTEGAQCPDNSLKKTQCPDKSSSFIVLQQLTKLHSLLKSLENLLICPSFVKSLESLLIMIRPFHPVDISRAVVSSTSTLVDEIIKLLEHVVGAPNEDLGDVRDTDGKSDNVWKHFTKIRSTNDPYEVYAACHRCDKLLKAHPKKHGTSHLKRHIRTCSSSTNPSSDEDREMLHRLRTVIDNPYEQQKMDEKMDSQEDLTQLDPWDLNLTLPTPWYVTRSFNQQAQRGHWKEIDKELTAIRMDHQGGWKDIDKEIAMIQKHHQLHLPKPQYMGLRRTLQFHLQDGSKVDWIMLEYQQLDDMGSPVLLLQGCMVIRKVFRYDKDVVDSARHELERLLNADDGDGVNTDTTTPSSDSMDTPCSVFPLGESVNTGTTTSSSDWMDTPVDRKRKRTAPAAAASGHKSQVWMHFTKIHNADRGVVYVVCHSCDRGYGSGRSTNGTSHLWRHNKSCTNKRRRTENASDATTEWEAEIWPRFLLLKNYGEHQLLGMC